MVKIVPKTGEIFISVTHGCIKLLDSYRFLQSSLPKLVDTVQKSHFEILKKENSQHWISLNEKLMQINIAIQRQNKKKVFSRSRIS